MTLHPLHTTQFFIPSFYMEPLLLFHPLWSVHSLQEEEAVEDEEDQLDTQEVQEPVKAAWEIFILQQPEIQIHPRKCMGRHAWRRTQGSHTGRELKKEIHDKF